MKLHVAVQRERLHMHPPVCFLVVLVARVSVIFRATPLQLQKLQR